MKGEIEAAIAAACKDLFGVDVSVGLTRTDEQFGDYATNVALQLAKQIGKNPREVAEQIVEKLHGNLGDKVRDIQIAGPGFINLTVSDELLWQTADEKMSTTREDYKGKVVVLEYSDPNPFKVLHAGHLYQGAIGDAIAHLLKRAGADLHCVNFGGDVGLHVAKNMWAILQEFGGEHPEKLKTLATTPDARADWMAKCYVRGTAAYEDDEQAKAEIIALNKRIYQIHEQDDHESPFAQIYWTCRQWSYDYFDAFYARVGSHFEKYYPESQTAPLGLKTVREQLTKGVYEESDGAVIFDGEKYGLHTRVFINSNGLPTYETKDVGLSMAKWRDYHFDRTIIITGNDIVEYMKVVLKSIEQFEPLLAERTTHLTHGNVKLAGGVKMSSRKGNFLRATDVLDIVAEISREMTGRDDEQVVLGAVKYAFIKQRIGADIIYDPKESVSLEGNSGPYLQYAHARARSILKKANQSSAVIPASEPESSEKGVASSDASSDWIPDQVGDDDKFQPAERLLLRKISEYAEVVDKATNELMPHYICTYLYELAQTFNRFYEHNRVVGDDRQELRLQLVERYADVLKNGLELLGIAAPDTM